MDGILSGARRAAALAVAAAVAGLAMASPGAAGGQTMTAGGAVSFYQIERAPGPIVVDGRLDELGWTMAEQVNGFHRILNNYDLITNPTRAKMLWDEQALYVAFACTDPDIWAIYTGEDDPMWSEEVVEVFIDPDGDAREYLELEVNPLNAWVDLRIQRAFPRFSGSIDWDIAGLQTAVQVHGTVNDSLAADQGWTVEIAIPWTAMADSITGGRRPEPGAQWRLNLYRIERMGGRRLKQQLDGLQSRLQPLVERMEALRRGPDGQLREPAALGRGERRELARLEAEAAPIREEQTGLQKHYEEQTEYTAWSETWRQGFHDPSRFGVVRFGP